MHDQLRVAPIMLSRLQLLMPQILRLTRLITLLILVLYSRSRQRTRFRKTVSAVPSSVSLLIPIIRVSLVLTYGIPPEFRCGVHLCI